MTDILEKKSKSTQTISKSANVKGNARVRPILKDKALTEKFFNGEEIEVTKEQYDALKTRKWIEVKDGE